MAELVPPGPVILISTVPLPAGAVALIDVELLTAKLAAAEPPNVSAVAPVKFLPVIVAAVPPVSGPEFGLTEEIEGTGI